MEQQWDIYVNVEEPSHDDSKWRRETKCSEDIYAKGFRMDILEPHNTGAALSATSADVSSGKRRRHGAAAVFLGLLSLFLLASVAVLVVLWIQDKNSWNTERHELRTNVFTLSGEREQTESNEKTGCPDEWKKFNQSFYFVSTTKRKWNFSREVCESLDAHLVIIDDLQEQTFISQLERSAWIGLSYEEQLEQWRWVDGRPVEETFWVKGQPTKKNKRGNPEHCVMMTPGKPPEENWDDKDCENGHYHFICEKTLQ